MADTKRTFHSSMILSSDEVKEILLKKIDEENEKLKTNIAEDLSTITFKYDENKINTLSLFSGCGGLDLGFELAGLALAIGEDKALMAFKDKEKYSKERKQSLIHYFYSNDIFTEASESYKANFLNDIYLDSTDIRKISNFPKADIVLGGFPCPGFSEAGPRLVDDERNFLYLHFIRCLLQSKPKVFVAENVKGMLTLGNGEVFRQIVEDFGAAGYTIHHKLLDASHYDVTEIRERVILVGIRTDLIDIFEYPEETRGNGKLPVLTLKDAIWDLKDNPGEYFEGDYSSIFMSRNRKKSWDEPSFTIQASGRQAPIHPNGLPMIHVGKDHYEFSNGKENERRLSIKEIARIQTFPDWFYFSKGSSNKNNNAKIDLAYKQIGNAVPVMLAYNVGKAVISAYLKAEKK